MKKIIILCIGLVAFFSIQAQTTDKSSLTKEQVHQNFKLQHPGEEIISSSQIVKSGQEDLSKVSCYSVGWIELPSGCIGYTTYCHHSILFGLFTWWSEEDTTVAGGC